MVLPAADPKYKSPLHQMACTTLTDFWNDSCSVEELTYALANGAVGATSNPVIVGDVLQKEMHLWEDRIQHIIAENPRATEDQITWQVIEEVAVKGSELLLPVFERERHLKGRLSIQTNPKYYRNADRIVEQALHFNQLAPNLQVKIPVTHAGLPAIEEATYQGININATVSFTVPQAIAVAEAVERGLKRREAEGLPVDEMSPVCTIMVGRIDDWLRVVMERDQLTIDPGTLNWAGVAIVKRAYGLYQKRGYRARLLPAAYRCHMHWSEFIGGDLTLTIPYAWQKRFNASDIPCVPRMDQPVEERILHALRKTFVDFNRAYEENGMQVEEFDFFGSTRQTLRQFLGGYDRLVSTIREWMIPGPEKKI